ncbi:MAG: hypothetical protein FWD40_04565 [Treponema sp.]|nr:hypothetical protein [Treponema sp.]
MKLDLRNSISFVKVDIIPSQIPGHTEVLLCYELNPGQSCSIEPEQNQLLGKLIFTGMNTCDALESPAVTLPAGLYLFARRRCESMQTGEEHWLDLAVEQQKDGLWQRCKPGNLLYVRHLHEDGAFVTQVFRPLAD